MGFDEESIAHAIDGSSELGLLDDARFAHAFTRTQERSAKKGARAIRAELATRGVSKDDADAALAASEQPGVQRARAREAAAKKARLLRADDPRKARRKLLDFLLRKGYGSDIAAEVSRELLGESED